MRELPQLAPLARNAASAASLRPVIVRHVDRAQLRKVAKFGRKLSGQLQLLDTEVAQVDKRPYSIRQRASDAECEQLQRNERAKFDQPGPRGPVKFGCFRMLSFSSQLKLPSDAGSDPMSGPSVSLEKTSDCTCCCASHKTNCQAQTVVFDSQFVFDFQPSPAVA